MTSLFNRERHVKSWTLALDESGRFEGHLIAHERDELAGWVVGGVLLPGRASETSGALDGFRRACRESVGWPPHATDLDADKRTELLRMAGAEVGRLGGVWIFVTDARKGAGQGALGRFVRMFGATVDYVGRLVASLGGAELDARPAQRTVPLEGKALAEAEARGVATVVTDQSDDEPRARALLQVETRHALDALAREPVGSLAAWPQLASISVEPASFGGAHPGIALADLGCNRVYGGLHSGATASMDELLEPLAGSPVLVLQLETLRILRAMDRALREDPPDLVGAARRLARFESDVRAPAGRSGASSMALRGAALAARVMWERATARFSRQQGLSAMARALAARAEADLAAKKGSYEGTWLALRDGFLGDGSLAAATRAACTDRVLTARLLRLCLECANHRGDVASAERAAMSFRTVVSRGRSYLLLGEELLVQNLAVVALQNRLPASDDGLAETLERLSAETGMLAATLEHAGEVIALAADDDPQTLAVSDDPEESTLWVALSGSPPLWSSPDRERGMGYGTVARSHGFAGRFEEARAAALKARSLFGDSPFDRRINAATIARLEIERARLGLLQPEDRGALDAALILSGAAALLRPSRARDSAVDPGKRFALDIMLRALLFAPLPDAPAAGIVELLCGSNLYEPLSHSDLRSHPTELIARHAAELIRRHRGPAVASDRWFSLSIDLSDGAPSESTLYRLGAFTERLAADPGFLFEGAPGSLLNPSFEYR